MHSLDQCKPWLALSSSHFVDDLQHDQQIVRELRHGPYLRINDPALLRAVVTLMMLISLS